MNSPSLPIFSFASMFLVLLFLSSIPSTKADTNLVDSICKETLNYNKCLEALESDPRSKCANDLKDLAKLALRLAISYANDSQDFINSEIKGADGPDQEVLESCAFTYEAVVASFRSALLELEQDLLSASHDVNVDGVDVDNCEDAMVSNKVEILSLSDRNYQVKLYSNINGEVNRQ